MSPAPPTAVSLTDAMVLFDWNGTIVLDSDRARRALNGVLTSRALPALDADQFATRFRLPMAEMFAELGIAHSELSAAEAEWNAGMLETTASLRAGAAECLAALARGGARLGVVSAAAAASVQFDQRTLGLDDVWHSVHAPVSDKLRVLQQHRPHRRRAFYVGDTPYDMRCATAAGFVAVGVTRGYASPAALVDAGAEHVIDSLAQLLPIVAGRR